MTGNYIKTGSSNRGVPDEFSSLRIHRTNLMEQVPNKNCGLNTSDSDLVLAGITLLYFKHLKHVSDHSNSAFMEMAAFRLCLQDNLLSHLSAAV